MPQMPVPKIALFSGGSACRSINMALARKGLDITRIVPAWDSGGSSKTIRQSFDILSVGDIRQALMTMAHGEGRAGDVVKVCNTRLSDGADPRDAFCEFEFYAEGRHPLLERMSPGLRAAILNYLNLFRSRAGENFDYRNGSIGNFILTGAYLAHNKDINTAIFVFRKICGIAGNVWPASLQNDIELRAVLNNGKQLPQQHLITTMGEADSAAGIERIALIAGKASAGIAANGAVVEAVQKADLIVFGPGSFYTSILPHLLIDGVAEAVAGNIRAGKVFVGNILQCRETRGCDLADLLGSFAATWRKRTGGTAVPLTHVVANRQFLPFEKRLGSTPYVPNGAIREMCADLGAELLLGEYEDAWQRGQHDGEAVADILTGLLPA
ncbi:gluconeogenesis factor YvcK family protein [Metarhizobium album]|uniref:gluconeogenesis factor YvcK family protein n=1 Tax=Metarhizobium album TaxID=2182425 RepID=UPI001FE04707|nr:gluconeogenesis factor YvcK family protein [Rhizobium album]